MATLWLSVLFWSASLSVSAKFDSAKPRRWKRFECPSSIGFFRISLSVLRYNVIKQQKRVGGQTGLNCHQSARFDFGSNNQRKINDDKKTSYQRTFEDGRSVYLIPLHSLVVLRWQFIALHSLISRFEHTFPKQAGLPFKMRPLTEEETKTVFLKLSEYIGKNIERMINRSDERHCFRLIKVRLLVRFLVGTETSILAPEYRIWNNVLGSSPVVHLIPFFVLQDRCYYISESVMKASTSISRDNLLHVGTCLGKFTKSGKFRLHITALEYIAQYAKVRQFSVCWLFALHPLFLSFDHAP